jgi:hypothetical protein
VPETEVNNRPAPFIHLSTARRKSLNPPEFLSEGKKFVDENKSALSLSHQLASEKKFKKSAATIRDKSISNLSAVSSEAKKDPSNHQVAINRTKSLIGLHPSDVKQNAATHIQVEDTADDQKLIQGPVLDESNITSSLNQFSLSASGRKIFLIALDNPIPKNLLRKMSKTNKLLERRINPIIEPKIYQKRPAIREETSTISPLGEEEKVFEEEKWSEGPSQNSLKKRSYSFFTRRLSAVKDGMVSPRFRALPKNSQEISDQSSNSLIDLEGSSNTLNARFSSRRSSAFVMSSGKTPRRASESNFLGPRMNVSLIMFLN